MKHWTTTVKFVAVLVLRCPFFTVMGHQGGHEDC